MITVLHSLRKAYIVSSPFFLEGNKQPKSTLEFRRKLKIVDESAKDPSKESRQDGSRGPGRGDGWMDIYISRAALQ